MDHLSAAAKSAMMQQSASPASASTSASASASSVQPSPAPAPAPAQSAPPSFTSQAGSQAHTHPPAPLAPPTAEETIKAIVQSQGYSFLDRYVSMHHLLTPFQQQHATLEHLFDVVVKHYEAQVVDESDALLRFKSKLADERKTGVRHNQIQGDDAAVKAERKGPQMRMMDYGHPYYQQYRANAGGSSQSVGQGPQGPGQGQGQAGVTAPQR